MSLRRTTAALALCALTVTTTSGCMTRWASRGRWEHKNLAFAVGEVAVGAMIGGLVAYDHDRDLPADEKFSVAGGAAVGGLLAVNADLVLSLITLALNGGLHKPSSDD